MKDTILVSVDSAYAASILVVVREMMDYGLNDNPETNAIVDYMPALFLDIQSAAAGLWQLSNEKRGEDEEYKEQTARIVDYLRAALVDFEAIQARLSLLEDDGK